MTKLEIGINIRTVNGIIAKIINIDNDCYKIKEKIEYWIDEEDIKKASHNIMDLVEIGDLVNGYKVFGEYYNMDKKWHKVILNANNIGIIELKHVNIKTILTHEQIEQNQYVLEE